MTQRETMNAKERIRATVAGRPRDRVPVTPIFMAWAAHFIGRSYRDYYLDGDVLVAAQAAVVEAFGIDQISAISDPWREASAYGLALDYPEQGVGKPQGALIADPARDIARIGPLDIAASPRMQQRIDSVAAMAGRCGATHSVLGWVEGPLAEYADLRGVQDALLDLLDRPEAFHEAAAVITRNAIAFAVAQVRAGADMIGIGDAAASLIGAALYEAHVLDWERQLVAAIHEAGALAKLHICGNIGSIVGLMARTGADILDVDSMVPLSEARAAVGPEVALCGNLDPTGVLLQGSPALVAETATACIHAGGDRFLLMPGCEVPQQTPEANLRALCPGPGCRITAALRR